MTRGVPDPACACQEPGDNLGCKLHFPREATTLAEKRKLLEAAIRVIVAHHGHSATSIQLSELADELDPPKTKKIKVGDIGNPQSADNR